MILFNNLSFKNIYYLGNFPEYHFLNNEYLN
jgi:hypothetical protein